MISFLDFLFKKKFNNIDLGVYIFVIVISLIALIHGFLLNTFSLQYLVAYTAPIFLINLFYNLKISDFNLLSKYLTYFFLVVAFFQGFFPQSIISLFVNQIFIVDYSFGLGFRGVSGIFIEPSTFAAYFFTTLIIYFITSHKRNLLYFIFLSSVFLFLNRSASLIFFFLIFLSIFFLLKRPLGFILIILILLAVSPIVLALFEYVEIRAIEPILSGLRLFLSNEEFNNYDFISAVGGRRFLQNYAAVEMLLSNPFGNGIGSVDEKFFIEFNQLGYSEYLGKYEIISNDPRYLYDTDQVVKPYSYILQLTYDFGYIIFLPLFLFFLYLARFLVVSSSFETALLVTAFIELLFFSNLSIYAPWIKIGFLMAISNERK